MRYLCFEVFRASLTLHSGRHTLIQFCIHIFFKWPVEVCVVFMHIYVIYKAARKVTNHFSLQTCLAGKFEQFHSCLMLTFFSGVKWEYIFKSISLGLPGWFSSFIKLCIINPHMTYLNLVMLLVFCFFTVAIKSIIPFYQSACLCCFAFQSICLSVYPSLCLFVTTFHHVLNIRSSWGVHQIFISWNVYDMFVPSKGQKSK